MPPLYGVKTKGEITYCYTDEELANITKEKVALIDLNLQLGDVTTFLDLNPSLLLPSPETPQRFENRYIPTRMEIGRGDQRNKILEV